MLRRYRELLPEYDAVILSDYGKGVLNEVAAMIAAARAAGKPVLIDPKGADFSKYAGATLLTPNRAELRDAAGGWENEAGLTAKAQGLRETLGLDALLVTRSEEGMTLYRADGQTHQPTRAQEVYDVSGAGDTVIAAMGLCLAAGYTLTDAMHAANAAAGVVVAKLGTNCARRWRLAKHTKPAAKRFQAALCSTIARQPENRFTHFGIPPAKHAFYTFSGCLARSHHLN